MPNDTISLLDWILNLLRNPDARAQFADDPHRFAAEHGFDTLAAADVNDALCLVADSRPAGYDHGELDRGSGYRHLPPPPHPDDDGLRYLRNYITNNYVTTDRHKTNIDNSIHQTVDTDGGSFSQIIDNDPVVASGDGAVAAGGGIRDSTVTTGDRNVIGDGNHAVTGEDNTTAFGAGDATDATLDNARFGDGAAASFGGDAYGSSTDNDTTTSVRNSGSGETSVNAAGDHGQADQYADQSTHDTSTHSAYEDSSTAASYDRFNSHNTGSYDDAHNVVADGTPG